MRVDSNELLCIGFCGEGCLLTGVFAFERALNFLKKGRHSQNNSSMSTLFFQSC